MRTLKPKSQVRKCLGCGNVKKTRLYREVKSNYTVMICDDCFNRQSDMNSGIPEIELVK